MALIITELSHSLQSQYHHTETLLETSYFLSCDKKFTFSCGMAEANFPRRTTNQIGAVAHWRVMSTVWNSRPQSVLRRRHFVDEPAVPLFLGRKKTAHTFAL